CQVSAAEPRRRRIPDRPCRECRVTIGRMPNTDAEPMALIHARGLTKRFGDFTAVDEINFDVGAGEAFGFLGPNGAGKTSTMRMIAAVSPRTGGELNVL